MESASKTLRPDSSGWVLATIVSGLTSLALGLALVWLNIEKADMGYYLRQMQGQANEKAALHEKLDVERSRLLSPYILGRKAEELGMRNARPGQIRRMDNALGKQ